MSTVSQKANGRALVSESSLVSAETFSNSSPHQPVLALTNWSPLLRRFTMAKNKSRLPEGTIDRRRFLQIGTVGPRCPSPPFGRGPRRTQTSSPIPRLPTSRANGSFINSRTFQSPAAQNEWVTSRPRNPSPASRPFRFPLCLLRIPEMEWSPGYLLTCELFLNGKVLMSYLPERLPTRGIRTRLSGKPAPTGFISPREPSCLLGSAPSRN